MLESTAATNRTHNMQQGDSERQEREKRSPLAVWLQLFLLSKPEKEESETRKDAGGSPDSEPDTLVQSKTGKREEVKEQCVRAHTHAHTLTQQSKRVPQQQKILTVYTNHRIQFRT